MITVYFDRNVFADICELRNGITQHDVEIIHKAVETRHISVPLSSALLAETTAILQKSSSKFTKHIETVFSLVSRERMVKNPDNLLRDDCESFAYLAPFQRTIPLSNEGKDLLNSPRAFLNKPKVNSIFFNVANNHPQAMREQTKNISNAISSFRKNLEDAGLKLSDDFTKVWNEYSIKVAKRFVDKLPVREKKMCKRHGIEKMLEIRSIRLYTVYFTWVLYSGLRGIQGDPRKLKSSDFIDFIHIIESSAAEIFVTQESNLKANKLPFIINQIPFIDYKVMNLNEFIKELQSL